ncbi:MAG: RidA family protein [Tetrasphaera sp.]
MERRHAASGSPYEARVGFSRAVRLGNHIAVSGTAPIWPDGGVVLDPHVQARRCFEIALEALAELGGTPQDVVRTRMFITSTDVVDAVSQAHGEVFGDIRPAATMVVVAGLVDERWKVEVELDAISV